MEILEMLNIPYYKKGSGIHIKEENKGKFTLYCNGNQECILKGKNSSNPVIRKRATFADNARRFKHLKGGLLIPKNNMAIKAQEGTAMPVEITADRVHKSLKPRPAPLIDTIGYYIQAPRRENSPTIQEYWSDLYKKQVKEELERQRIKDDFIKRQEEQIKAEKAHERYVKYQNSSVGRGLNAALLGLSVAGLHPALKIPAEVVNTIISIPEAALAFNDMKYNGVSIDNTLSTISAIPFSKLVDALGNKWVNKALAKRFGTSTWDSRLLRLADTYFPVINEHGVMIPSVLQSSFRRPEYMLNAVPNMLYDAGNIIIDGVQLKK